MSEAAPPTRPGRRAAVAYLLLFGLVCLVAFAVIQPFAVGQVGFDSAASVLYFDRLVQGRHLESFITTTPKPLLTFVYGLAYSLTHDWRPISWLVIAMFGLSAVLAAELVRRIAGPAAAAFAAVAVLGSVALFADVAISYAVVWAFVACLIAGLLVETDRPRYGLAGLALGVGALARFEVMIVLGLCLVVLVVAWLWARFGHRPGPDPRAWRVLIGLAAVPIQFIHDWLLTGNWLYSEYVPVHASERLPLIGPIGAIQLVVHHVEQLWPLVLLAAVGGIVLVRGRHWAVLLGLIALGPGVGLFLVFLAYRDIYVAIRYTAPIDLSLVIAAAVGFGGIAVPMRDLATRRLHSPMAGTVVVIATGILVAVVASVPFAPVNDDFRADTQAALQTELNEAAALPFLRAVVAERPELAVWPGQLSGRAPAFSVPSQLRPQFIVDLGLPTTQVAGSAASQIGTEGISPAVGQIVVHDRILEPDPAFQFLEVNVPTTVGKIRITPLLADPVNGLWVDRIDPAP